MTSRVTPEPCRGRDTGRLGVGAEVEQQRGVRRGEQGDRLVHAAGRGAGHLRLGADAGGQQPVPERRRRAPRRRGRRRRPPPRTPRAAELDSPPPTGTVESSSTSSPGTASPSSASAHTTPAAYAAHPVTLPAARSARRPSQGWSKPALAIRSTPSSRGRRRGVRRVGQRNRQAEAAVVVGVLADQVHPPGRAADHRGRHVRSVRRRRPRRARTAGRGCRGRRGTCGHPRQPGLPESAGDRGRDDPRGPARRAAGGAGAPDVRPGPRGRGRRGCWRTSTAASRSTSPTRRATPC